MQTILLVNNDPAALSDLEELLRRSQYAVIATRDGSSAIAEIASEERIDLVIMDHRMNGIHDFAILMALRRERPDVPAIILTEHGTLCSYLKAISLGVTAYHEHTVGNRELLRTIADALGDRTEAQLLLSLPARTAGE